MNLIFKFSIFLLTSLAVTACTQESSLIKQYLSNQDDGLYGSIKVNDKIIFFTLFYKQAPLTVTNFVGLATGKFADNIDRKGNYFDGIKFHRVVEDFVVQGGDPTGTGTGGPGYYFADEFHSDLIHNEKGILSMANSGPNTNGSQFFITLSPTPHLDNKHSVFGKVVEGLDNLDIIVAEDEIQSVGIHAKGKEAKEFLDNISWDSFNDLKVSLEEEANQKLVAKRTDAITALEQEDMTKTSEGIYYTIITKGKGKQIANGDSAEVHYELKLYGAEQLLDSSYQRGETFIVEVGSQQVIPGWEIILQQLHVGDKARVILPPELAYGDAGAGNGVIPPGAFLDFTIEVLNVK